MAHADTCQHIYISDSPNLAVLLAKIGELEAELQFKNLIIEDNKIDLHKLRVQLNACIQNMLECSRQFSRSDHELKNHYKEIAKIVQDLREENRLLERSNVAWAKWGVTLQFEALAAQDEAKAAKVLHDIASNKAAMLEAKLKTLMDRHE